MNTHVSPPSVPRLTVVDGIARVTLQRPAHRNRIEIEDLLVLQQLFQRIDSDKSIRVLVLTADVLPDRPVFSAGFNIGEFDSTPPPVTLENVMQTLENLRPVTICALNGSIYGGATDFAIACDLAFAVEGIHMRLPAAALGLHYHASGLNRYISRIGVGATKLAFLTAQPLEAQTLLRIGYVQEVWPARDFDRKVGEVATAISGLAPLATDSLKLSINELARGEYDSARMQERIRTLFASEDFAEGRRAFAERRRPIWRGC